MVQRMIQYLSNYNDQPACAKTEEEEGYDDDDDDDESALSIHEYTAAKQEEQQRQQDPLCAAAPPRRYHSDRPALAGWGELEDDGTEPLMVFHPHHGGMVDLKHNRRLYPSMTTPSTTIAAVDGAGGGPCPDARQELINYFTKFWNETFRSDNYNVIEKFVMLCELPVTLLRMVRIQTTCRQLISNNIDFERDSKPCCCVATSA